jgi:glycosyltransferase involved in cell wall biosynthesis
MNDKRTPAVWFPAIRANTGADVFTETLATQLQKRGFRAEITWLPLRAEYAPWTTHVPRPPEWANLVHVNTWLHRRFIPRDLPVIATMHHCVHDPAFAPYKSPAQAFYHRVHIRPLEHAVLRRADAVVAVSSFTAEHTQAVFGTNSIVVIPNGIDVANLFHPVEDYAVHRPLRLVFIGSGSRRKGVDLLGPIMERLGLGFELAVVGATHIDGPLPPNVRIVGRVATRQNLAAAYREADVLLFPSRLEGFGLVAAEAMACGLPVIASGGSALTEVVEDGVTGFLCPRDDIDAFVEAARRLAADPEFAASLSRAARRRAVDAFSIDRMVEAYVKIYLACLERVLPRPVEVDAS